MGQTPVSHFHGGNSDISFNGADSDVSLNGINCVLGTNPLRARYAIALRHVFRLLGRITGFRVCQYLIFLVLACLLCAVPCRVQLGAS